MPLSGTPAPPNKRRKPSRVVTDLSHVTQDEFEGEPEASEFDLGTKIRSPRDIMLEELSLMKNKGSKMFRMRKARMEKFIYENNPDLFTSESMENFQNLVPSLGGQMVDIGGHLVGKQAGGQAPVPPPKPGSKGAGVGAGGMHGIGGAGGQGRDGSGVHGQGVNGLDESKKGGQDPNTYMSPWERAMKGNEDLTSTMKSKMPGPKVHCELPKFKSFNRTAIPFGGFEKASQLMTFQLPDIDVAKEEPEPAVVYQHDIGSRPSFNRTPIGWVVNNDASSMHMEMDTIPFDGETDDL
ncbi:myozenin-1a [Hypomesus transpacificus]|uniref:myozenin-1a n=1 Tax=Hypomesus transpacificus TaxID=137520 RepID=UPI001F072AC4|nr:myozenin-1a [Hypomesus transpacificus]